MIAKNDLFNSGTMLRATLIFLLLSLLLRELRGEKENFFLFAEGVILCCAFVCVLLGFCGFFQQSFETKLYLKRQRMIQNRGLQLLYTIEEFGRVLILFNPYSLGRWTEAKLFAALSLLIALLCLWSPAEKTVFWVLLLFSPLPSFCGIASSIYRQKAEEELANEWHFTAVILALVLLCSLVAVGYLGNPGFML